jgi:hypothetical protein
MLMVVVGAGASYDSVPTFPAKGKPAMPDRLPLANELFQFSSRPQFAQDVALFPQCAPVLPLLENQECGITVERVLQQLQEEAAEYPERHKHLTAIRYYLNYMVGGAEGTGPRPLPARRNVWPFTVRLEQR